MKTSSWNFLYPFGIYGILFLFVYMFFVGIELLYKDLEVYETSHVYLFCLIYHCQSYGGSGAGSCVSFRESYIF